MNPHPFIQKMITINIMITGTMLAQTEPLIPIFSGPVFQGSPPDENHPWAVHDRNRPQPVRVEPGTFSTQQTPGTPPSDAIALFDGTPASLQNWESANQNGQAPMQWKFEDGAFVVTPRTGNIRTKQRFGDVQLHLEWQAPTGTQGEGQGRANSGVFFAGGTEVQILANYNNPTYADGFAGAVYGVNPPMANALRPDGEWQTYDIIFRRPVYQDGVEIDPGRLTVFINGVVVQDATPLEGGGGHMKRSRSREFEKTAPIMLQDHGDVLRFRNIWIRHLPARSSEGGTDGPLSQDASIAKRAEIAAGIRAHANTLEGRAKLMRTLESLAYQVDSEALNTANSMLNAKAKTITSIPAGQLDTHKHEILELASALNYLADCQAIAPDHPVRNQLNAIIAAQDWKK